MERDRSAIDVTANAIATPACAGSLPVSPRTYKVAVRSRSLINEADSKSRYT